MANMPPHLTFFRACCCLVAALLGCSPAATSQLRTRSAPARVRQMGQTFVSSGKADALSVAIVRADRVETYHFGETPRGGQAPPTDKSVYEIGSITKLFTSLLLAHAVREREINLSDDIRRYLPGDYPNLAFEGSPIRIADLADTTSALPDNLPDFQQLTATTPEDRKPFVVASTLAQYSPADMLRDLHFVALLGRPGMQPRHSNLAAELLGYLLSRNAGQSYQSLLQSRIQRPFGMANGVAADDPALLVQGYDAHHNAMPAADQPAMLAAGGLRFSIRDMAGFLQAELAATNPAVRLTQQPAFGNVDAGAVGLGWQISRNVEGALKLNASGGTYGSASYVALYPELRMGIVLLANRSGETEGLLYDLADKWFAATEGTPAFDALTTALGQTHYQRIDQTVARIRQKYSRLNLSEGYVNNWAGGLLGTNPRAALALSLITCAAGRVAPMPGTASARLTLETAIR